MDNFYDYKKFAILYVDDEEKSLKYFNRAFQDRFRILTAANAQAGLQVLEANKDEVGVLMTDQRMPGEKGVWLLERARQLRPRIVRILATAYSDMDAAIAAVNTGAIYKYVTKPWDPPQLENTLARALEFFIVQRERDQLLTQKMSVLHNMMIADRIVSLGLLAAGLSHHIRNSLVAVKTFLDLAPAKLQEEKLDLQGLRNPEFWKEYYQNVQSQIDRINAMLKDLWAASDAPPCAFNDEIRLRDVVSDVAQRLHSQAAAKNIHITNNVPESLPPLKVDKPKFLRLFELLLKDEIVSLPAGSHVTLSAEALNGQAAPQPEVHVRVTDNGPGLPKEALRTLFDPFALRSDSPTEFGISLMACFFIVHHHGGRIEASNTGGQGTNFDLRLPLDANVGLTNGNRSREDEQDFLKKVILNDALWQNLISAQ